MNWFLHDNGLRHKKLNVILHIQTESNSIFPLEISIWRLEFTFWSMTDPKPQVSVSVIYQRELLLVFENFVKNLLLNWLYFFYQQVYVAGKSVICILLSHSLYDITQ